jgi:glycosyltransferase involved in cell wall biosynthesis
VKIAIITTDYHPLRSSAAVQLRDLARGLIDAGHEPVVLAPTESCRPTWREETVEGVRILHLAAPRMKRRPHWQRGIAEACMPFAMIYSIWRSPYSFSSWDAVIWYSPSIFFGPLVVALKFRSKCPTYLILRDIFPQWALDLGLLRKGLAFRYFQMVTWYQYQLADTIGVQSESNLVYLQTWAKQPRRRLEVLHNWLAPTPDVGSSIQISKTELAGRTIFVYIGNMGIAQGMDILLDLAESLLHRADIGFLFVGRGTEVPRLRAITTERDLSNVIFHDEIDPHEIFGLLAQCHVGLVALDPRHKTHNIPGKFLTYMQAGLPVLARINSGSDLGAIIESEGVGRVFSGESLADFNRIAVQLIDDREGRQSMSPRARSLSARMFAPESAVRQILAALSSRKQRG